MPWPMILEQCSLKVSSFTTMAVLSVNESATKAFYATASSSGFFTSRRPGT